jgi:hypothetical protein
MLGSESATAMAPTDPSLSWPSDTGRQWMPPSVVLKIPPPVAPKLHRLAGHRVLVNVHRPSSSRSFCGRCKQSTNQVVYFVSSSPSLTTAGTRYSASRWMPLLRISIAFWGQLSRTRLCLPSQAASRAHANGNEQPLQQSSVTKPLRQTLCRHPADQDGRL